MPYLCGNYVIPFITLLISDGALSEFSATKGWQKYHTSWKPSALTGCFENWSYRHSRNGPPLACHYTWGYNCLLYCRQRRKKVWYTSRHVDYFFKPKNQYLYYTQHILGMSIREARVICIYCYGRNCCYFSSIDEGYRGTVLFPKSERCYKLYTIRKEESNKN